MHRTELWQVTIKANAGAVWKGSFLNRPKPSHLMSAILDDIKENSEADQDANADESDQEVLSMEEERLRMIHDVAEWVSGEFATQHGLQRVKVAGTEIGGIQVVTDRVFNNGK